MTATFDITPEKHGSLLNFFYRQLTYTPPEVSGVNLLGKTAIVVGASSGVGLECSRQLLDLGVSKLILAVRNEPKGQATATDLSRGRENFSQDRIEVWKIDLSSYNSVSSFAERTKGLKRIDFIILNAGRVSTKMTLNPNTGHEETIQVNYLSTALLAILLLPIVKSKRSTQQQPTRITFTSSDVAAWTSFKERKEDPLLPAFDKQGKVDMADRMMVSKLLGQFFLFELAGHVRPSVAVINSATPGMIHDSEFNREIDNTVLGKIAKFFMRRIGYSSAIGARMVVDAAVNHSDETHGQLLALNNLKP